MPRLTTAQWETARADYEIRGDSLSEIGRRYGVSQRAVAKQAKFGSWVRGRSSEIAEMKASAVIEYAKAEKQSSDLPNFLRQEIDDLVTERLQQEGVLASLSNAIARKARIMANNAETLDEIEQLSRVKKNLTPPSAAQTQVTVQQAALSQAQGTSRSPEEICDALLAEVEQESAEKKTKKQSKKNEGKK